jgi:hypothetical protein
MSIDPCDVRLLGRWDDKTVQVSNYGLIPYGPALLTMAR